MYSCTASCQPFWFIAYMRQIMPIVFYNNMWRKRAQKKDLARKQSLSSFHRQKNQSALVSEPGHYSSAIKLQIQQQKKAERDHHKIFAQNFPCTLLSHLHNGKVIIAENTSYIFCCFYEELCFSDTKRPRSNAKLVSK